MNKIILTIGLASSLLSDTTKKQIPEYKIVEHEQLIWSIDNLDHLQNWVLEDLHNEIIDSTTARLYWETIKETQEFVLDYYEKVK